MFLSLPPHPKPQMTYIQDAVWSQFQAQANAASNRPWVLPGWGQEDADSWEPSGLVTRSLEFFTPPPPCEHTQPCPCVQRGIHTCAEMWSQMLVPDASPRVPPEGAIRYCSNSAKPSPCPPAPARLGVWWSRTGQRSTPPIPLTWAVPATAQY